MSYFLFRALNITRQCVCYIILRLHPGHCARFQHRIPAPPTSIYEMGARWYNILFYFPCCILNTTKRELPHTHTHTYSTTYTSRFEIYSLLWSLPSILQDSFLFPAFPTISIIPLDQRHSKFHIYPSSVINNIHSRRISWNLKSYNSYFFCLYRVFHFIAFLTLYYAIRHMLLGIFSTIL